MKKKKVKKQTNKARLNRSIRVSYKLKFHTISDFKKIIDSLEDSNKKRSSDEDKIIKKLKKLNVVRQDCIATNKKLIHYGSNYTRVYSPDIIYLDKKGHIVVLEVKEFITMAEQNNMSLYKRCKDYCKRMGYRYGYVTKSLQSIEEIRKQSYNRDINKFVKDKINERGKCTYIDLKPLFDNYPKKYLPQQLTRICIVNNYVQKGSLIHERNKLRYKKRK